MDLSDTENYTTTDLQKATARFSRGQSPAFPPGLTRGIELDKGDQLAHLILHRSEANQSFQVSDRIADLHNSSQIGPARRQQFREHLPA